ncbi:unnamed protein product, partial [Chrysoparadoxa australica]
GKGGSIAQKLAQLHQETKHESQFFQMESTFPGAQAFIKYGAVGLSHDSLGDTEMTVDIGMESLLIANTLELEYERDELCPDCHGHGAMPEFLEACPLCSGSGAARAKEQDGVYTQIDNLAEDIEQVLSTTCPRCQGWGEVVKGRQACKT